MIDLIGRNIEKPISTGSYPIDYKKIGDNDEIFKVFINQSAIDDINSYLSSDKSKELGGILLGNLYLDETDNKFIVINDIVIARFTEANVTRLTFTHKSWEDINNKIEKVHSDKRVLGWFHSHPGHTVFLSSYDKFIHENFFNHDFMVAYVFDPVNNEQGFYSWKNNELVKSNCFFIYSDYQFENEKKDILSDEINIEKKTKKNNKLNYIFFFISILSLILSVILLLNYFELKNSISHVNSYDLKLKELKEENAKINSKLNEFIQNIGTGKDSIKDNLNFDTIKYQIKPGDNLRKLAVLYYNDEGKYNLLIRHNNLKDENDIAVGQIIEIPMER